MTSQDLVVAPTPAPWCDQPEPGTIQDPMVELTLILFWDSPGPSAVTNQDPAMEPTPAQWWNHPEPGTGTNQDLVL